MQGLVEEGRGRDAASQSTSQAASQLACLNWSVDVTDASNGHPRRVCVFGGALLNAARVRLAEVLVDAVSEISQACGPGR